MTDERNRILTMLRDGGKLTRNLLDGWTVTGYNKFEKLRVSIDDLDALLMHGFVKGPKEGTDEIREAFLTKEGRDFINSVSFAASEFGPLKSAPQASENPLSVTVNKLRNLLFESMLDSFEAGARLSWMTDSEKSYDDDACMAADTACKNKRQALIDYVEEIIAGRAAP